MGAAFVFVESWLSGFPCGRRWNSARLHAKEYVGKWKQWHERSGRLCTECSLYRRAILLNAVENGDSFYRSSPFIAEPVPKFDHSRRAPLVVFASFEDKKITHIADGKKETCADRGALSARGAGTFVSGSDAMPIGIQKRWIIPHTNHR